MKVFVAGGTGAIGAHAVPALIGAGHSVTALAGSSERAAVLSAQGATPVSASIFDQAALTDQLRGHEAVVNLTSAIRRSESSCSPGVESQQSSPN